MPVTAGASLAGQGGQQLSTQPLGQTKTMPESLEEKFKRFIASLPGVEVIDKIIPSGLHQGKRRADYLLQNRQVILELKTLKTDPSPKVDKELEKHQDRDDYPIIYGEVELQKILRHLPDRAQINQRIYRNVTRSVEDAIRSAEKQIRDTKGLLQLENSIGMLVLLNESIDVLSPDVVVHKTSELLCRQRDAMSPTLPIDFVWLLFKSHVSPLGPGLNGLPSMLLQGESAHDAKWFIEYFEGLQKGWAYFNGVPLIRSHTGRITDLYFQRARDHAKKNTHKLTRQQYWEQRYEANPYLRTLPDDKVLAYGARVLHGLAPYFLKGGPRLSPRELEPLLVAWSNFLQESTHRGLDLRNL